MHKRDFLKQLGKGALASPFLAVPIASFGSEPADRDPYDVWGEDKFWERIRKDYALKPDYINLENGYYNIAPIPTLQKFWGHIQEVNYQGSYYMRTVQWDNKKRITARLAALVGCNSEEVIITRNTTESLDMIIGGFPWQEGDEAIYAIQDYGAMRMHFQQVAKRHGVVNKEISIPNHPKSDEELVALYEEQITPRTRLIMLCHMINITGQIMPVRKICEMAHRYGVEVMVDGAHCIGHIQVDIPGLKCDYYGSSLHKWLSTPLGAGLLYVKKDHIPKIWPLLAEHRREAGDIGRLNHTGTHPVHTDLAIDNAIDYLELIGLERKENRMRFLQRYWSEPLRKVKNIEVNTPEEKGRSCGIANVGINHMKPADLAKTLLEEFNIFTVAIDHANVRGCRITPNVYTTTAELDRFISAMKELASRV
ncbi:aminotransferase class V-fold PLP-dependent enzyme [Lentiprolixibacter aurantiacus]|uniref:Aminotransferase class V-fold PLP-dependent enzyme n=1 Tax=Lentiprolixibacter aurantiacus TaxID=2993939 RepID=A0AAE3SM86_9FLAO|nr:aminotransferase class V-fold PLP-dependent enzyme [Lentiprolixibacter aurantiacus]MCX2718185.1 aminotransferase class V-fold PLP-dependent enzyme [Lentiprolixibacter aurantiacus]